MLRRSRCEAKLPMLIREQGRLIKMMRVERSSETRRNRHKVIGAFRVDGGVPASLLDALENEERRVLSRWLATYQESQDRARAQAELVQAAGQLEALVAALAVAADALSPADADHIWLQLKAIAQNLKRAGHLRPRPMRRPPIMPGQLDLVDELRDAEH
jgi:hypothetical protein